MAPDEPGPHDDQPNPDAPAPDAPASAPASAASTGARASASEGAVSGPRRDRRRVEGELDELNDTVGEHGESLTELREQLAALRRELDAVRQPVPAADASGGEGPRDLAELHHWLYRTPEGDDDSGGDILALQTTTEHLSAALEAKEAKTPALPCWAELDADAAQKAWEQLVDWLCGVLIVRYPSSASALRPCWFQHPELVENLTWLHNAWTLAYRDPNSPISLAADWHIYWLPHVMTVASAATRKCYDKGVHDPTADSDLTSDNVIGISADLDTYIADDLTNRPPAAEQGPRRYVVPPRQRPVQPWAAYRRHTPTPHSAVPDQPYPGPTNPAGPHPGAQPATGRPNPYR